MCSFNLLGKRSLEEEPPFSGLEECSAFDSTQGAAIGFEEEHS